MTYLIGLSGPPRSGKDSLGGELAQILWRQHPGIVVETMALAQPLRDMVYTMIGQPYSREHYELAKDAPHERLGGQTIREAMIQLAQKYIRPHYGWGFFAHPIVVQADWLSPDVLIVTDMGFPEEVDVFVEAFGAERCVWAQVERPGADWAADSRGYVGRPAQATRIINDETITTGAGRLYGRLLNQFRWDLG